MREVKIAIESLDYESVVDFFLSTVQDFPDFKSSRYLEDRAMKLSEFAEFVTCRTFSGKMVGMIAFYRNRPPLCYITHVSVLARYKGYGMFGKMCDYLTNAINAANRYQLIKLEVRKDNQSAIECYRRFGFEFVNNDSGKSVYMVKWL